MGRRLLPCRSGPSPPAGAPGVSSHERGRPRRGPDGRVRRVRRRGRARRRRRPGSRPRDRAGSRRRGGSRARSPVQSTTVEAGPPWAGPPSRMRSMASPSWATISAASRASGRPEMFAEVVGSGPTPRASARGASWSGTRRPIVGAPPVRAAGSATSGRRGTTTVRPPGQNAAPSAVAAARSRRSSAAWAGVGEEQHDRPCPAGALHLEQALDAARGGERDRDRRRPCRSAAPRSRPPARAATASARPASSSGTTRARHAGTARTERAPCGSLFGQPRRPPLALRGPAPGRASRSIRATPSSASGGAM